MEAMVIPPHPSISVFSGSQGGGKSTLVANLLTNPSMYGKSMELLKPNQKPRGYFDAIFLMIGSDDDMYDKLIDDDVIQANHVCHRPTPEDVQRVIDEQRAIIERLDGELHLAPRILFIFDDVANDGKLMRSKAFLEVFVKGRHINSSTWFLSQYLNLIPKACRLQANCTFVFKCNLAELKVLADQYTPPNTTKKEFFNLVLKATTDTEGKKNNFLFIYKRAPEDQRFRQNLDSFIHVKRLGYKPKLSMPKKPTLREIDDRDFEIEETVRKLEAKRETRPMVTMSEHLPDFTDRPPTPDIKPQKPKARFVVPKGMQTTYKRSQTHK